MGMIANLLRFDGAGEREPAQPLAATFRISLPSAPILPAVQSSATRELIRVSLADPPRWQLGRWFDDRAERQRGGQSGATFGKRGMNS